MCGILGFINTPWNDTANTLALKPLYNRGPDEQNFWVKGNVYLGHTRLSVIDIAGGHQPMVSNDGRYVLVFNGEIYNFRSLRKELKKTGYVFLTESDTEVILAGYIKWKGELTKHLDGMFAFSIWDNHEKVIFCARDRVGIKPFFYSTTKGFFFSSSLKSFIDTPLFPKDLDFEALRDFLAFQTCMAPNSFLKEVRQLPPATQLTWSLASNRITVDQYWRPKKIDGRIDKIEIIDEVDEALRDSVANQLVSDVPLGAFLSGGIDSSLMVHYMDQAGAKPIDVFTLRFDQDKYNETPYAEEVARHFGCNHHVLDAPKIDGNSWLTAIDLLDQPLGDPAYVVTNALSRLTKKHVTVSISGDGGDELFAGYSRFKREAKNFPQKSTQTILRSLVERGMLPCSLLGKTLYGKEFMLYRHVEVGPWKKGRKSMRKYLNSSIYDDTKVHKTLELWTHLAGDMDTKGLMNADLWTYLSDNCLTKTDRASMAHGLEIRVPMLGNRVLDLATSIPIEHHFDSSGGKRILKELSKRYLPECTWNRKKHGLAVPLQDLFNGSWEEPIDDLVDRSDEIAPFLDSKAIKSLWKSSKEKKASRKLSYTFAVLLRWLEINNL